MAISAELVGLRRAQGQRLLAEDVQALVQRGLDHREVRLGRRRDDDRVEWDRLQHGVVVTLALDAGVLAQDVQDEAGRVTDRLDADVGMSAEDGQVGDAHLSDADNCYTNHDVPSGRGPTTQGARGTPRGRKYTG